MKHIDKFNQLEHQQVKKVEMELAREAAMKAFEDKVNEKRNIVEEMKVVSQEKEVERQEKKQEEVQRK